MKKFISLLIAFAMLFCFAACGEKKVPLYSQGLNDDGYYGIKFADVVKLPDYKALTIPADEVAVTDTEVASQLNSLASQYKETNEITDRAVENGDSVSIDFSGSVDGVQFDGGTATDQIVTAGSEEFIDDFLTQIIGHMPGDTFNVEVTFPETYPQNPDLAGKDATFIVVINYIRESISPEINDEFIKTNFGETYKVSTVDEMNQYIKDALIKNKTLTYIDDYLYNGTTFAEIPQVVTDHQTCCVRANYEDMAESYGIELEQLVSYSGYETLEELLDDSKDEIAEMAKDMLLYQAVAADLGLKVSNNDVADYFEEATGNRDYSLYKDHYGLAYLKMMVLNEKATDYIVDNAKIG